MGTKYDDDDVPTVLDNEVVPNNVFLRRDSSDNRPTLLNAANHNAFSFLRDERHLNVYRMYGLFLEIALARSSWT